MVKVWLIAAFLVGCGASVGETPDDVEAPAAAAGAALAPEPLLTAGSGGASAAGAGTSSNPAASAAVGGQALALAGSAGAAPDAPAVGAAGEGGTPGAPAGGAGGASEPEPEAGGAAGAPAEPACVCETGQCCDGCNFRPRSYFLGATVKERTCSLGTQIDIYDDYYNLFCDGQSADGTRWGPWVKTTGHDCPDGQSCQGAAGAATCL